MKTFLNVLYRRILYKIPLKLLLILLAVFGVLFACFSSADTVPDFTIPPQRPVVYSSTISNSNYNSFIVRSPTLYGDGFSICLNTELYYSNASNLGLFKCRGNIGNNTDVFNSSYCTLLYTFGDSVSSVSNSEQILSTDMICYFINRSDIFVISRSNTGSYTSLRFGYTYLNYDTLKSYFNSGYIEESSVDSQYCVSNNLCPSNVLMTENQCKSIYGLINSDSCPSVPDCPDNPNIGTSNLYINDIFHPGAYNIIMNIPDEIDWDYAYTNSGQNFNLDVVGYNVDYEKIDSIVQFQNYKPTSEDFQRIIGLLAPYTKIIVFFVFLFIVWAWIKKPFKSKKL